jgi:predicted ABC-type transport system involved in lysophospholipase L1 biosynthesis ATPase subunit
VSKRAVDAVFQSLFLLSDLRALLRETAPAHTLDESQKEAARTNIAKLKRQVAIIEEELL